MGVMAGTTGTARAIVAGLALMTGACKEGVAQSTWQPAAGHTQIPIWPGPVPDARSDVGTETLNYAVDDEGNKRLVAGRPRQYIENVTLPTITVYAPKGVNTGAAVLVFPGGGFNNLAIDIEGTEACDWLTSIGVTCVLVKYRVPCKHVGRYNECPPAHQDAQRAMRIVRSRAAEWRINPNTIGVLGFSAGAHMVVIASIAFDKRLYHPVDAVDSVSSRPDFALSLYQGRTVDRRNDFAFNPDIQISPRTPPTFLVHSYDDSMNPVENTLAYAVALRKAGVSVEAHIFATGGHAFGLRRTEVSVTSWPDLAKGWMAGIGMTGLVHKPAVSH